MSSKLHVSTYATHSTWTCLAEKKIIKKTKDLQILVELKGGNGVLLNWIETESFLCGSRIKAEREQHLRQENTQNTDRDWEFIKGLMIQGNLYLWSSVGPKHLIPLHSLENHKKYHGFILQMCQEPLTVWLLTHQLWLDLSASWTQKPTALKIGIYCFSPLLPMRLVSAPVENLNLFCKEAQR